MSGSVHPRQTRLGRRLADLRLLQSASGSITQLTDSLDRQLANEQRPSERMRMLRETTNQITRLANDAIHAYTRVRATLKAENEMDDGDQAGANEMRRLLGEARAEVLRVLEATNQRYAWGYVAVVPDESEPETIAEAE